MPDAHDPRSITLRVERVDVKKAQTEALTLLAVVVLRARFIVYMGYVLEEACG